jgi:eukaryotic-like serine/threonine-protein kinase
MSADPKRVRDLFLAAAELPAADRAAYLSANDGGDAELRAAVERLLAAHEQPAPVLLRPAPGVPTADYAPITETVGTKIGPYKLMEQIGEGGFGLVFVAEQTEPVRRKVALKVIKPGMDSRQVIARFQAERQALAMMDHPNIARVLDAGATESGRPYFVMELVRGIPITAYCDQNRLPPRERLELFVSVCHAIQHAHQKGVIHRDIKPSNVLVTSHDGKPVAKVIDFGVAKAIHQPLTERTIYTNFAQMIGTPQYMSPEQAEMSSLDIDTRSDIYSLGVLLYEMLTGSTPLAKKRVAAAAYDEIRRLIREEEPPKPSTRLSTSDSLASIAAQRHTEPAKLSKLVRGDLDWITMKALEKDRTRRYETANGLARDIQRYLADELVEARPPSTAYRLRKFARKNRAALTTAVALVLLLVAGITASTWLAVRATRAEAAVRDAQQAEAERAEGERRANAELAAKNTALAIEQAKVQARFDLATRAIALFHTGISEDMLLKNPKFKELRTKLLKEAAGFYTDLEKLLAGQTDAKSRKTLAEGYFQLAELTDKIGDKKQALAVHRKALELRRELAEAEEVDVETRLDVARSLMRVGDLLRRTGDTAGALAAFEEQREIAMAAETKASTDASRTVLALSHHAIGTVLAANGKSEEAIESYRKALAIRQELADTKAAVIQLQLDLSLTHTNIGILLAQVGRLEEARVSYRKAWAITQKLFAANPGHAGPVHLLALQIGYMSDLEMKAGKPKEAMTMLRPLLTAEQALADANPAVIEFQVLLGNTQNGLGVMLRDMGKPTEALQMHQKALAIRRKLADANPAVTGFQSDLALSHVNVANMLERIGKPEEALAEFGKALAIQQKLADTNPTVTAFQDRLAEGHNYVGRLFVRQERFPEAFTALAVGLSIRQKLVQADPKRSEYAIHLGDSHASRGWARVRFGQPSQAAADLRRAVELWAKGPADDLEDQFERSRALALLAGLGRDAKSGVTKAEAAAFADRAIASLRYGFSAGWGWPDAVKEPDFDALRERDDFKKLLAEREAKAGPKAKPKD